MLSASLKKSLWQGLLWTVLSPFLTFGILLLLSGLLGFGDARSFTEISFLRLPGYVGDALFFAVIFAAIALKFFYISIPLLALFNIYHTMLLAKFIHKRWLRMVLGLVLSCLPYVALTILLSYVTGYPDLD